AKGYVGAWSNDSKIVAIANVNTAGNIYFYDCQSGAEVRKIVARAQVYSLAFSRDDRMLIVGGSDGAIYLIELSTGNLRARLMGKGDSIWRAHLAPDGITAATTSQKEVAIWDIIAGREITRVPLPVSSGPLAFSPDGKIMACGMYDKGLALWDLRQGKEIRRYKIWAYGLAFTPDGQTLAAACMDSGVRLWDVASGDERHEFRGHAGWATGVAVSPDGRTLLSCGIDTTVLMWPIDSFVKGKPVRARLSAQEWKARLAGAPAATWDRRWADLASPDAAKAYEATWGLIAEPKETVTALQKWIGVMSGEPIDRWIADLDHTEFVRREEANKQLERLGRLAELSLREALNGKLSVEARRRIERLLALREAGLARGIDEGLRLLRAIEVLEYIGTPEARGVLEALAVNAPSRELGREAKASIARLAKGR
ncbi:MAG: WD40 repeat domain-containing protein, partial [Planctomycetes bacterium]|nr:WD40 repeat domain-containing protein [Planctomycetota bacterium]